MIRKVGVFLQKTHVLRVATRLSELHLVPSNPEALARFAKIGGKLSRPLSLSLHPVSTNMLSSCVERLGLRARIRWGLRGKIKAASETVRLCDLETVSHRPLPVEICLEIVLLVASHLLPSATNCGYSPRAA